MYRKMCRKIVRWKVFGIVFPFALLTVSTVFLIFWFMGNRTGQNQVRWRMEQPFLYDETVKEKVIEAQAEGLCCVLWKKNRNVMVENPEFSRRECMNAYGIAGNPAALFSGANVLWPGEEGHCLLSADAACKLFGSTDVIGKSVKIGQKNYEVAGIQHETENLCVYQLSPTEGQKVSFAACWYEDRNEKYMVKKRVMTLFSD